MHKFEYIIYLEVDFIFRGFSQSLIDMMINIRFNNNKEYMHENKAEYIQKIRDPYYSFIEEMSLGLKDIDSNMELRPQKCLSRIYRDTRFSKDKSPYRDHHWCAFRRANIKREEAPMFWFEIRIEGISWGLGFWGENKGAMSLIRQWILEKPELFRGFNRALADAGFMLEGSDYKKLKTPQEIEDLAQWYLKKELYIVKRSSSPAVVFNKNIAGDVLADYKAIAPIYTLFFKAYDIAKVSE